MKLDDTKIRALPNWSREFPGLVREHTRHGKEVWYVRSGADNRGPRVRIRAPFGTPQFRQDYDDAVGGKQKTPAQQAVADRKSLAWLITEYRSSGEWLAYSPETKYQREYYLQRAQLKSGHERYRDISKRSIIAARDGLAGAASRHFLDTMRGLFKWAELNEYVPADPTAGVSYAKKKKGTGYRTWTEEELARYERHYPLGTKERVWIAVLQFLGGPRRGDAVALGRQHVRKAPAGSPHSLEVVFKTEKSQRQTEVTMPMLPEFMEVIAAGPIGETTFICGANGRALVKETFGNYFRQACNEAGLKGLSAHGVRKGMATRMADRGASETTLMAVFGWTDPRMPAVYTKAANKKRLSRAGASLLAPPSDQEADICRLEVDGFAQENKAQLPHLPKVRELRSKS